MKGTLKRADLGAGAWVLEADDGERYQLSGVIPAGLEGKRVKIKGDKAESWGFAMAGPTIEVKKIEATS